MLSRVTWLCLLALILGVHVCGAAEILPPNELEHVIEEKPDPKPALICKTLARTLEPNGLLIAKDLFLQQETSTQRIEAMPCTEPTLPSEKQSSLPSLEHSNLGAAKRKRSQLSMCSGVEHVQSQSTLGQEDTFQSAIHDCNVQSTVKKSAKSTIDVALLHRNEAPTVECDTMHSNHSPPFCAGTGFANKCTKLADQTHATAHNLLESSSHGDFSEITDRILSDPGLFTELNGPERLLSTCPTADDLGIFTGAASNTCTFEESGLVMPSMPTLAVDASGTFDARVHNAQSSDAPFTPWECASSRRIVDIAFPSQTRYQAENERYLQRGICARLTQDAECAIDPRARRAAYAQLAYALLCVLASQNLNEVFAWAQGVASCAKSIAVLVEAVDIAVGYGLDWHVLSIFNGAMVLEARINSLIAAALVFGISSVDSFTVAKTNILRPHMPAVLSATRPVQSVAPHSANTLSVSIPDATPTGNLTLAQAESAIPLGVRTALMWLQMNESLANSTMSVAMAYLCPKDVLALVRAAAIYDHSVRAAAFEAAASRGVFLRIDNLVLSWARGAIVEADGQLGETHQMPADDTNVPLPGATKRLAALAVRSGWPQGAALIVQRAPFRAVRCNAIRAAVNVVIDTSDVRALIMLYDSCNSERSCLLAFISVFKVRNIEMDCLGRVHPAWRLQDAAVLYPRRHVRYNATDPFFSNIPHSLAHAIQTENEVAIHILIKRGIKSAENVLPRAIWFADDLGKNVSMRAIVYGVRALAANANDPANQASTEISNSDGCSSNKRGISAQHPTASAKMAAEIKDRRIAAAAATHAAATAIVATDLFCAVLYPAPWIFVKHATDTLQEIEYARDLIADGILKAFERGPAAMGGTLRAIQQYGSRTCEGVMAAYTRACESQMPADQANASDPHALCTSLKNLVDTCISRILE